MLKQRILFLGSLETKLKFSNLSPVVLKQTKQSSKCRAQIGTRFVIRYYGGDESLVYFDPHFH